MMNKIAALSLAAAVAAAPAAEPNANANGPTHINIASRRTLETRQDGSVDAVAFLTAVNNTLAKYKAPHLLPTYPGLESLLKKRGEVNDALTDQVESPQQDELYYGPISINSQSWTVDFDTGSADLWVPGPGCTGCTGTQAYNEKGTDEHRTTSVTYGSGSVSGEDYFDTVGVQGLTATNCSLISVTSASGFSTSNSQGLMGMGFSTIAESGEPTYFENLMSQGKASSPEFSFYLGRAKSNTQSLSELTIGGADASRYTGSFTSVPVTTKGYWQVALGSLNVAGKSVGPTSAGQAAIDTGTTIVLAPTDALLALVAAIPGAELAPLATGSAAENAFTYPCASSPNVSITFAGKQFAINNLDLNGGTYTSLFGELLGLPNAQSLAAGGSRCIANIIGADIDPTENLYVVGDTFIKNWYSTFSYAGTASVNFAAAKGNNP